VESASDLAIVRRAYAKQILAAARISDTRLQAAFAAVPREDFLGPGPWLVFRMPGFYQPTVDADPVLLYVNELFGLAAERHINNGQPSLHAALLAAAAIQPEDHVVHIGAGTGYYTAIMSVLAGRVTAVECDSVLAARARGNLSRFDDTRVIEGNGAVVPLGVADVIYVNAGVTHPVSAWLDALADGGRLIIPLTTDTNTRSFNSISGLFFRIQRRGALFEARALLPTAIIAAEGIREPSAEAALAAAFAKGGWGKVARLVRGDEAVRVPDDQCWLRGDSWCLATENPLEATGHRNNLTPPQSNEGQLVVR
jgi:protein-L-isoaspartate(D-aspartate) O-methyltransferase